MSGCCAARATVPGRSHSIELISNFPSGVLASAAKLYKKDAIDLVEVFDGAYGTKPLVVTFAINEFWRRVDPTGRIIGDDCFDNWFEITDRPCFSWFQTLGYLQIFYWYDLEWEGGYPFGGEPMFSARQSVSLLRYDPLPGEPEATRLTP